MKTLKIVSVLLIISLTSMNVQAQKSSKWQEAAIKVSSQCGMCKDRIEEHLAFEKGVKKSEVDLEKDVVVITYNSKKTDLDKLRKSISKLGYDADEMKADQKAYEKLPDCCKKPTDQKEEGHDHKNCNHQEE